MRKLTQKFLTARGWPLPASLLPAFSSFSSCDFSMARFPQWRDCWLWSFCFKISFIPFSKPIDGRCPKQNPARVIKPCWECHSLYLTWCPVWLVAELKHYGISMVLKSKYTFLMAKRPKCGVLAHPLGHKQTGHCFPWRCEEASASCLFSFECCIPQGCVVLVYLSEPQQQVGKAASANDLEKVSTWGTLSLCKPEWPQKTTQSNLETPEFHDQSSPNKLILAFFAVWGTSGDFSIDVPCCQPKTWS